MRIRYQVTGSSCCYCVRSWVRAFTRCGSVVNGRVGCEMFRRSRPSNIIQDLRDIKVFDVRVVGCPLAQVACSDRLPWPMMREVDPAAAVSFDGVGEVRAMADSVEQALPLPSQFNPLIVVAFSVKIKLAPASHFIQGTWAGTTTTTKKSLLPSCT